MGQHKRIIIYVYILFENTCSDSTFQVWLGMRHFGGKESVENIDGTRLDVTYWGSGQPDNLGGVERCIHIGSDSRMYDIQCNTKMSFICRK